MIVIIQGLVILFAGALEHMFRPSLQRIFYRLGRAKNRTAAAVIAGGNQ
jgi:hypothetical protein